MVVVGPLVGGLLEAATGVEPARRPDLWVASELPFAIEEIPADFRASLRRSRHLILVEEHVAHGGAGEMLARCLLSAGEPPRRFTHHHAAGYPSGRYGSAGFHRRECGLDAASIIASLTA
jgi:transketolase